jgi:hypothetical protein
MEYSVDFYLVSLYLAHYIGLVISQLSF